MLENENLTIPCFSVLKCLCINGAQCVPALTAMLYSSASVSATSADEIFFILNDTTATFSA